MNKNEIQAVGTCFLSPHSDDIVMSSFAVLHSKLLPEPYTLLTIFSDSNYVEPTKANKYKLSDITNIRITEDKEFAALMSMKYSYFSKKDCLKRLNKVIFKPNSIYDKALFNELYNNIVCFLFSNQILNIVVHKPNGEKQHIDHQMIWSIANEIYNKYQNFSLYYVDDIPYSIIDEKSELFEIIYLSDTILKKKHNAMDIYSSQMCSHYHEQVDCYLKNNNGHERLFKRK